MKRSQVSRAFGLPKKLGTWRELNEKADADRNCHCHVDRWVVQLLL